MFRLYGAERCYLCTDALAEYADLSFGDFWTFDYSDSLAELERCTLISQRTQKGMHLLQQAAEDGFISLHPLPMERASKRILNMSRGKKSRSYERLRKRIKKGQPLPDYHCTLPLSSSSERLKGLEYRVFSLFRAPYARKMILKILFSPVGVFLNRLNVLRKNLFCSYHGN